MALTNKCMICAHPDIETNPDRVNSGRDTMWVDCPYCGRFEITWIASAHLTAIRNSRRATDVQMTEIRHLLSEWLRGGVTRTITVTTIEQAFLEVVSW